MKNNVKVPVKLTLSVIAACLVSFCGLITETAVNIAFPAVMSTFGVSTEKIVGAIDKNPPKGVMLLDEKK